MTWNVSLRVFDEDDDYHTDTWPGVHRWLRDNTKGVRYRRGLMHFSYEFGYPRWVADAIMFERKEDAALFILWWAEIVTRVSETIPPAPQPATAQAPF